MNKEIELFNTYLSKKIDRRKPVTLKYQIENFKKRGFIDNGEDWEKLQNFETFKKINNIKYRNDEKKHLHL